MDAGDQYFTAATDAHNAANNVLAAKGFTTIESVHYIKRGYEMLEKKLQKLGAQIELTSSDKDIQKFKLKVG